MQLVLGFDIRWWLTCIKNLSKQKRLLSLKFSCLAVLKLFIFSNISILIASSIIFCNYVWDADVSHKLHSYNLRHSTRRSSKLRQLQISNAFFYLYPSKSFCFPFFFFIFGESSPKLGFVKSRDTSKGYLIHWSLLPFQ